MPPRAPHAAYLYILILDKLLVEATDALGTNRGSLEDTESDPLSLARLKLP